MDVTARARREARSERATVSMQTTWKTDDNTHDSGKGTRNY